VGAEGFVPIACFLKRYALFSLEPMPNISCSVSNSKTFLQILLAFIGMSYP